MKLAILCCICPGHVGLGTQGKSQMSRLHRMAWSSSKSGPWTGTEIRIFWRQRKPCTISKCLTGFDYTRRGHTETTQKSLQHLSFGLVPKSFQGDCGAWPGTQQLRNVLRVSCLMTPLILTANGQLIWWGQIGDSCVWQNNRPSVNVCWQIFNSSSVHLSAWHVSCLRWVAGMSIVQTAVKSWPASSRSCLTTRLWRMRIRQYVSRLKLSPTRSWQLHMSSRSATIRRSSAVVACGIRRSCPSLSSCKLGAGSRLSMRSSTEKSGKQVSTSCQRALEGSCRKRPGQPSARSSMPKVQQLGIGFAFTWSRNCRNKMWKWRTLGFIFIIIYRLWQLTDWL